MNKFKKGDKFPIIPCFRCSTELEMWHLKVGDDIPKYGDMLCEECLTPEESAETEWDFDDMW